MIYPWSVIELSFARELFLDYIKGSENFDNKVIEIQSLSGIIDQTCSRNFLDRYTDRKKYQRYDSNQKFLSNMGYGSVNNGKALASLVTLTEMRKTTPAPIVDDNFKETISNMAKNSLEKKMLSQFLGKMEQATSCLMSTDPQFQFLPISDLSIWDKIWEFIFLGHAPSEVDHVLRTYGYWFIIDKETSKYKREFYDQVDPKETKYVMIRSIDLEDYYKEVDNILDGGQFSLNEGTNLNNILYE